MTKLETPAQAFLKDRFSRRWGHASGGLLALLTLGLVIWAGVASGHPPLLHNLSPVVVALGFWGAGLLAWYAGRRRPISTFFLLFAGTLAAGKLTALDVGGDLVRRLIGTLSPRREEVITLRFFGGLRNKEIAALLELDERTVASHLCRGLRDLHREYVDEFGSNEEMHDEQTR